MNLHWLFTWPCRPQHKGLLAHVRAAVVRGLGEVLGLAFALARSLSVSAAAPARVREVTLLPALPTVRIFESAICLAVSHLTETKANKSRPADAQGAYAETALASIGADSMPPVYIVCKY